MRWPIATAAASCMPGKRCSYVFMVQAADACPSLRLTTYISTPTLIQWVAAVWRSVWNTTDSGFGILESRAF